MRFLPLQMLKNIGIIFTAPRQPLSWGTEGVVHVILIEMCLEQSYRPAKALTLRSEEMALKQILLKN